MKVIVTILAFISFIFAKIDTSIISTLNTPYKHLISQLYALNNNEPLWINRPQQLNKVLNALNNPYYNYKYKNFNQKKIEQYLYALDSGSLNSYNQSLLDIMTTDAYLKLLHFVRDSDVDWNLVQQKIKSLKSQGIKAVWEMHVKPMPSASTIYSYISRGRVIALLNESIGMQDRYKSYIDILQYYRKLPEFEKIPYGRTIKYGDRDRRIYAIKRRMLILGDYPRQTIMTRKFDRYLAYAIQKFRKRFNLRPGAYIDNKLIAYLNLPKSYYIKKIITNLDKTKLYPPHFENLYVEVNVPEFYARLYQNHQEVFGTEAVVGRIDRPTPIFSDYIEYVVLNPTWNVPQDLIKKDLMPALKKYPNVIEMARLDIYRGGKKVNVTAQDLLKYEHAKYIPYRVVQRPGPQNALGLVKFMFPNKYAVYLHDTPEKGLFRHKYRYNSSGCIRLQDPFGLLDMIKPYLVNQDVDRYLNSGKTYRINLKRKIPIHIVYFTLEFADDGSPKFLYDAYMYDKMIQESVPGNMKYSFEIPAERLREIR